MSDAEGQVDPGIGPPWQRARLHPFVGARVDGDAHRASATLLRPTLTSMVLGAQAARGPSDITKMTTTAPVSTGATPAPASAGAGLDVELAKCESQLSDWVHCPSSKTSEGKAKIAEITARRDDIKARMHRREQAVPRQNSATAPAPAAAQRRAQLNGLGGFVDVYA